MPITDPQGTENYWAQKGSFRGLNKNADGTETYWMQEGSLPWLFPAAAGGIIHPIFSADSIHGLVFKAV